MKSLFPLENNNKELSAQKNTPENILSSSLDNWELIKNELKEQISSADFETWIAPISPQQKEIDSLNLIVPNSAIYKALEDGFLEHIEECKESLGLGFMKISLNLEQETNKEVSPNSTNKQESENTQTNKTTSVFSKTLSKVPKLNTNYTFSRFVRGPSNQFALATCQNVAENPGVNYNPLLYTGQQA